MILNRSFPTLLLIFAGQWFKFSIYSIAYGCIFCFSNIVRAAEDAPRREVTKADLPRISHTEVADVLDTFQLAHDFKLEIVAAEPGFPIRLMLVSTSLDACLSPRYTVIRFRKCPIG